MAERLRILAKPVDFRQLHVEFAAQSAAFKGLCGTTGQIGDTIRIIDADDLSNAQVDAIIAAHVPPTADQAKTAEAAQRVDDKFTLATLIYVMKRINEVRTQPAQAFPALTAQDVRAGIAAEYRNL